MPWSNFCQTGTGVRLVWENVGQASIHANIHAYMHARQHTYVYRRMHTHTCVHTYVLLHACCRLEVTPLTFFLHGAHVEVGLCSWLRFASRVVGVVFWVAIAKFVHLSVAGRSLAHAWSLWDRARSCRTMTHHLL